MILLAYNALTFSFQSKLTCSSLEKINVRYRKWSWEEHHIYCLCQVPRILRFVSYFFIYDFKFLEVGTTTAIFSKSKIYSTLPDTIWQTDKRPKHLKFRTMREGPQSHPQGHWFPRMTDRTQHIVLLIDHGVSSGKTRHKLPKVLSQGVTQDALNSLSNELWQYMWNVASEGSSLETQCPGFLLEANHMYIPSWHIPRNRWLV